MATTVLYAITLLAATIPVSSSLIQRGWFHVGVLEIAYADTLVAAATDASSFSSQSFDYIVVGEGFLFLLV